MAGILVGGQGRRMGGATGKHLVPFGDERLVDPVLRAASAVCSRVVVVGDGPGLDGLEQVPDDPNSAGPVAGILGLMRAHPEAALLVLACDMPLMSETALRWLLDQRRADIMAVLPSTPDGQVQPLGAVYEPGCRVSLAGLTGGPGPISLAGAEGVLTPTMPEGLATAWTNVNDPGVLQRLLDSQPSTPGG